MSSSLFLITSLIIATAIVCRSPGLAASNADDDSTEAGQLLPFEHFPDLDPWQRCLFVCRRCYSNSEPRLHCVNNICLDRIYLRRLPVSVAALADCPEFRHVYQ
ncbi:hypothetical protein BOX15_Mlig025664g1 [Macrostomum lignano]|uniref:Secreted protein n=1 Tax=Macrostomum lignano TaxID=282301 RepID=A0A267FAU3_9PLAT|nr:hypothetical protein BOX15_Mlig025664g1 [Macrostomum lignano]